MLTRQIPIYSYFNQLIHTLALNNKAQTPNMFEAKNLVISLKMEKSLALKNCTLKQMILFYGLYICDVYLTICASHKPLPGVLRISWCWMTLYVTVFTKILIVIFGDWGSNSRISKLSHKN